MTVIRCPLNSIAEQLPNSPALISADRTVTFSDLEGLVRHTALNLKSRGLQRHSHIAILSENSIEYCVLIFAAIRIGAIICPISNRWPKKMIKETFDKLDCNFFIRTREFGSIESNSIEAVDINEIVPSVIEHNLPYGQAVISLDNPATMIFTSGSTSQPRAVLLSYGNLYTNAKTANKRIPFNENHRWLLSLPLYHVGGVGVLFRSIVGGGAVVIQNKKESIISAINKYDITHLSLVPTQLYRLIHSKSIKDLKSHPIAILGGGPATERLVTEGRKAGFNIYTTYGLTEMASQVTTDQCINGLHSGKLLDECELKIDDDGEVLVKGDTLFIGYVENGEAVIHLDNDGWFRTGDIGSMDSTGHFHFLGRKDNMLISGGENIYPEEIEIRLMQIDGIEQAIVVAVSDEEYGQRPVAFVKYRDDKKLPHSSIVERLKKSLPKFKVPKVYLDWSESETDSALKPSRERLTKLAEKLCANPRKHIPKVSS